MRVHRKPRRTLFVPTGTKDGPPVGDLETARITDVYVVYSNEHREVRDRWNNRLTATKELPYRWTGSTVFQLKTKDAQQPRICMIADMLNEAEPGQGAVEGFEEKIIVKKGRRKVAQTKPKPKSKQKRSDLPPLTDQERQHVNKALQQTVVFEDQAAIDGEATLQHKIRCCLYPKLVSPSADISAQASENLQGPNTPSF